MRDPPENDDPSPLSAEMDEVYAQVSERFRRRLEVFFRTRRGVTDVNRLVDMVLHQVAACVSGTGAVRDVESLVLEIAEQIAETVKRNRD